MFLVSGLIKQKNFIGDANNQHQTVMGIVGIHFIFCKKKKRNL